MPFQVAALTLVIKPPSPVSLPFQAMVPPMLLVLVKLALGLSPRLLPHARGQPTLMLLKEDAVMLFSYSIYHRSRLIVLLNMLARNC